MALPEQGKITGGEHLFATRGRSWAAAAALFLIAWFAGGYQVFQDNQALQLPLVERLVDPSLFPHDPFVATLTGYSAPLWWAVAALSRLVSLPALLVTLFALEKLCLLLAGAALAGALRPQSRLAPWAGAVAVALGVPALLGSEGKITASYFEQTAAAMPFFLWSFAALIRGERWKWALFCAIGSTLNPMYGAYALTYSAAAVLVVYRRESYRWLAPLLLSVALAGPTFIFAAHSHASVAADPALWLAAVKARFPHHLLPLTWDWTGYFSFALLVLLLTLLASHRPKPEQRSANRFILASTACSIGWLALAFVAAYRFPLPGLLVMHPARATDLWYGIGAIFLVAELAYRAETAPPPRQPVLVMALLAALLLFHFAAFPKLYLASSALLLLALRPPQWACFNRPLAPARLALLLISVALIFTAGWSLTRAAAGSGLGLYTIGATSGELEVAQWARTHTRKDALFAVPTRMDMFRPIAQRGVIATWKDGSAILWDKQYVSEWVARMNALGRPVVSWARYGPVARREYPDGWSDAELKALCNEFGAGFCMLPIAHRTSLPEIFRGRFGFKVVKVS